MPEAGSALTLSISLSTLPAMTTTGTFFSRARLLTPLMTLPRMLWLSNRPSPVRTRSQSVSFSSNFTKSSTASMPGQSLPFKKARMPAPKAPAAPEPGTPATETPSSR